MNIAALTLDPTMTVTISAGVAIALIGFVCKITWELRGYKAHSERLEEKLAVERQARECLEERHEKLEDKMEKIQSENRAFNEAMAQKLLMRAQGIIDRMPSQNQ